MMNLTVSDIIIMPINHQIKDFLFSILTMRKKIERALTQGNMAEDIFLFIREIVFCSLLNRLRFFSSSSSQVQQLQATPVATSNNALLRKTSHHLTSHPVDYDPRTPATSMSESENREHGVLKRDKARTIPSIYKPLTEEEFLVKTSAEIRQEFRRMANPPAQDPHAAK